MTVESPVEGLVTGGAQREWRTRRKTRQRQRKRNSPNEREERSLRLPQSLTVRVPRALRQAAVQASLMIPSPRRLVGLSVSLLWFLVSIVVWTSTCDSMWHIPGSGYSAAHVCMFVYISTLPILPLWRSREGGERRNRGKGREKKRLKHRKQSVRKRTARLRRRRINRTRKRSKNVKKRRRKISWKRNSARAIRCTGASGLVRIQSYCSHTCACCQCLFGGICPQSSVWYMCTYLLIDPYC